MEDAKTYLHKSPCSKTPLSLYCNHSRTIAIMEAKPPISKPRAKKPIVPMMLRFFAL